jgi:upstream activation factor subunit UAF30
MNSAKAKKAPTKSVSTKNSKVSKSTTKTSSTPVKSVAKTSKKTKEEPVVSETLSVVEETPSTKQRKVVDRDTVLEDFDALSKLIDAEIENLRQNSKSNGNVKFLRSLNKNLKVLRTNTTKVMKKKKTERKNNSTSGFLKPVTISGEMAKFTGWDPKELRSRVEVTKYICDYIKSHDLQNPEDRREIRADAKLQKLLGVKPEDKIKYYSLQTHLKKHFPKTE